MDVTISKSTVEEIKSVISSDGFTKWLLSNTTSFAAAAWIMQTLFNAVEDLNKTFEENE